MARSFVFRLAGRENDELNGVFGGRDGSRELPHRIAIENLQQRSNQSMVVRHLPLNHGIDPRVGVRQPCTGRGDVIEKGEFRMWGAGMPASATQHRPELAGRSFRAMGFLWDSPRNPHAPTSHANVRLLWLKAMWRSLSVDGRRI